MASESIIVAVIALLGTLAGTFAGIITSTKLVTYRIEQLEKKVEKHNSLVEKVALLQRDLATAWTKIDELKKEQDAHSSR